MKLMIPVGAYGIISQSELMKNSKLKNYLPKSDL